MKSWKKVRVRPFWAIALHELESSVPRRRRRYRI
jgi:hypothetical protein